MEKQIYQILKNHKLSLKKREAILSDLMKFLKSKVHYDPLDDEESEISQIGREISEMSDEDFESNLNAFKKIVKPK